ncbi:MAG TPA: hypothetical protein VJV79_18240 [Polyangiaceae bacterium]|nr:hypothetical protein [Polyangiaceae bacterium]
MSTRSYWLALLGVSACSSGVGNMGAPATATMPATHATSAARSEAPAPNAASQAVLAPLEYHHESDSVRVSVQNTERAIREYTEFIARAGESPEYARAVKRSREQIQDLRDTLVFIRAGSAEQP